MSAVTLEQLEQQHAELAKLIDAYKAQAAAKPSLYVVPQADIRLAPGERYAGLVLQDDGQPGYHLVLLPARGEKLNWKAALKFATKAGGELPNRREQALLYANLKAHFEAEWYWSSAEHESDGSYAWFQTFSNGFQSGSLKSYEGRAVAVRRLSV